jgi:6-methylsalicylic acid synthase
MAEEYSSTPGSVNAAYEHISKPHSEDVAIVGMSCRTAGGNHTLEKLWNFIMKKKNASGQVPKER